MYTRYPFDRGPRVVSLQVAQKIAAERDEILARAQRLQRENERLRAQLELVSEDREEFFKRAEGLEEENQRLKVENEQILGEAQARAQAEQERSREETAQRERVDQELVEGLRRQVQSLSSDLDRLRRREVEVADKARRQERIRVLDGLGGVLDSVDRALRLGEPEGPWREGLEGIEGQIEAFLRSEGAQIYGEIGETMDPHLHEALAVLERPDFESGAIVEVERRGISLADGTVVRPAQVIVAR